LIAHLNDPNKDVRCAACKALGELRDSQAVDALVTKLDISDIDVCLAACEALGQAGDFRAVEPLLVTLGNAGVDETEGSSSWRNWETRENNRKRIRAAASTALAALGQKQFVDVIESVGSDAPDASERLAQLAGEGDLRVIDVLRKWAETWSRQRASSLQGLRRIYQQMKPNQSPPFCRECRTRFERRQLKTDQGKAHYFACRLCGKASAGIVGISRVVCVLERGQPAQLASGDTLHVGWTHASGCFDFDAVEIHAASDDDVERFCVQVGNDVDAFRRSRYKKIPCAISLDCHLSDNTIRILKHTLGRVAVVPFEEPPDASEKARVPTRINR